MNKRKLCDIAEKESFLKLLSAPPLSNELFHSQHYRDIFSHLIGISVDQFFESYWETFPCHFRRNKDCNNGERFLFFKKDFIRIIQDQSLIYGNNVSIVKYINGTRTSLECNPEDKLKASDIRKAFNEGYTVQFYQPQRFIDGLYHVNAGFEYIFGTLAGASAYMTPSKAQGLAPHYDDVDVFIIQTEGQKQWHLWQNNTPLPETYSPDISRADLPTNMTTLILSPGDILYMPRGTIHEAIALDSFSTHITVSVYQYYNYKTFIQCMFPKLLQSVFEADINLRRGLPRQISSVLGSYIGQVELINQNQTNQSINDDDNNNNNNNNNNNSNNNNNNNNKMKIRNDFYQKISDMISSFGKYVTTDLIDEVVDEIQEDFMKNRLPPPDLCSSDTTTTAIAEKRNTVKKRKIQFLMKNTVVRLCDPLSFLVTVRNVDGLRVLALAHSRNNKRICHMGHPTDISTIDKLKVEEERETGEDSLWTLLLPYHFHSLLHALHQNYVMTTEGISIGNLHNRLQWCRYDLNDVCYNNNFTFIYQ